MKHRARRRAKDNIVDGLLTMIALALFGLGGYLWVLLYRWHPWSP